MVFTVTLDFKKDIKNGLLDRIEGAIEYLKNNHAESGVIDEEPEVEEKALLNEYGGFSKYEDGPFKGETVLVPGRPFIHGGVDNVIEKSNRMAANELKNGLNLTNARRALNVLAREAKMGQEHALESNGEGIAGWQKHNEPRTVATKGFDKPLYTRHNKTFPISNRIVEGGL